ncbi:MAG: tRNA-(ms[2]io[6]A)-hydroxylase [Pseudomonadales bacterium]|jgi:tRNA-(ms[2]io[6]A)-hydroxylase
MHNKEDQSFELKSESSQAWLEMVLENFDEFLLDHAANERKASSMAMSMVAHYPDKPLLLTAMIDLALEELTHFKQVVKLASKRNLILIADEKDAYVNQIRNHVRKGTDPYFLDRLLTAAVIEARGAERFLLISRHIDEEDLAKFYGTLAKSEANHHLLFIELALNYFEQDEVAERFQEWLKIEQHILDNLPIRPRLH